MFPAWAGNICLIFWSDATLFQIKFGPSLVLLGGEVQYCSKMTRLPMLIFQSSAIKSSLEIFLVIPKEGIVMLKETGLAVPSCKGPSTMARNPTYAVLSRNELCRESRA